MKVQVRAHPGATRNRAEWRDGILHVWVTAPAVDGAANRALIRAVAEALQVRPAKVRLIGGDRSRNKLFEIDEL